MKRVLGCDISWWQGLVDFVKMLAAGAKFVIIRAGSINSVTGECYEDYNVGMNGTESQEAGMPKGFYWFYREFGTEKAIEQARFFWEIVDGWSIEEGLFFDGEVWDMKVASIKAFIMELQRLSGLPDNKIGIYSRASLWNVVVGAVEWFKKFLCWVARYANVNHPWGSNENLRMKPWDEYDYWQHSADGNNRGHEFGADSDDIDLNWKLVPDEIEPPDPVGKSDVTIIYDPLRVNLVVQEA